MEIESTIGEASCVMESFYVQKVVSGFTVLVVVLFNFLTVFGQRFSVDTHELNRLVDEWVFAHRQKSLQTFDHLYSDTVLFFGKELPRTKVVDKKTQLFQRDPSYSIKISKVKFLPYTSGIVKAVFENIRSSDKNSSVQGSYLLFSYGQKGYKIVGESDSLSDKKTGFTPDLGELIDFSPDDSTDSPEANNVYHPRSILTNVESSVLFSDKVLQVPIRTITIISSLLLVIFMALIFTVAAQKRKGRDAPKNGTKSGTGGSRVETQAFQRFVVTLFDPLYFKLVSAHHANSHHYKNVDLEFEFRKADVVAYVALKCVYFRERLNGSFKPVSETVVDQLQSLEQTSGETEFYLVIGMGGKPDDPAEIYLIPVYELPRGPVAYGNLQVYRKHGMFFYNASAGQLK